MSLPALKHCSKLVSPRFAQKIACRSSSANKVASCYYMSTHTRQESPPRPVKQVTKEPAKGKSESAPIGKGDTYIAGAEFYSYNPYSFYDIENEMESKRIPQPTGQKMRLTYCLDKLNPEVDDSRRLLPEEYGYLMEWPGMKKTKPRDRPVRAVIKGKYKTEGARIPL